MYFLNGTKNIFPGLRYMYPKPANITPSTNPAGLASSRHGGLNRMNNRNAGINPKARLSSLLSIFGFCQSAVGSDRTGTISAHSQNKDNRKKVIPITHNIAVISLTSLFVY